MLKSPLAGTAVVLLVMGLLAIPLRRLTSHPLIQPPVTGAAADAPGAAATPCLLWFKLLAPAKLLRIATQAGDTVLALTDPPAGESEHDVRLVFADRRLDLVLHADLGPAPADTAVFLTVMPDGMEPQTRYLIGSGELSETWRFDWGPKDHK